MQTEDVKLPSAQHPSTQHSSTQRSSTQHTLIQHSSAQHTSVQHPPKLTCCAGSRTSSIWDRSKFRPSPLREATIALAVPLHTHRQSQTSVYGARMLFWSSCQLIPASTLYYQLGFVYHVKQLSNNGPTECQVPHITCRCPAQPVHVCNLDMA